MRQLEASDLLALLINNKTNCFNSNYYVCVISICINLSSNFKFHLTSSSC